MVVILADIDLNLAHGEGQEDIYPGEMAGGVAQGLAADPKGIEKRFAGYLPG